MEEAKKALAISPYIGGNTETSGFKDLGWLDRYLALYIFLALAVGIILGNFFPNTGPALQKGKFVRVPIPIAIGLLVMMYLIQCKVKYEMLHLLFKKGGIWVQTGFSVVMNWIIAPLLALTLSSAFLPDKPELREGLILRSEGTIDLQYSMVANSVAVFLGIPVGSTILTRIAAPLSLTGLLFTIPGLFASPGHAVAHQITSVLRVAALLIFYFTIIFFLTLLICHKLRFGYEISAAQSFTAASNNFEVVIAAAVATYGVNSDQALAATVRPLIEVPVLLALVYVIRRTMELWGWRD
ncbi:hypothetical protein B0O99DRAFT_657447 [Bisporella sp. PMI_857]|nr:hypothetical protein B0O99DRAFT_657447 [Bisporella sp. PMI_857]